MSCMEEMGNAYEILVGKPEGKRTLARPRHRWQDIRSSRNRRGSMDWFNLTQNRYKWQTVMNTAMKLWVF